MTKKFTIIGAGMAGLLAAAVLRDEAQQIIEKQPELPNNHSALLRFRTNAVAEATNIPFEKVKVMKAVVSGIGNPVGDAIAYSIKTNGTGTLRSSVSANGQIEDRFIAPHDFIKRLAAKVMCPIRFDADAADWVGKGSPIISTLPMPILMNMLDYKMRGDHHLDFESREGSTLQIKLTGVNVCASLYLPSSEHRAYRASITRDRLILEFAEPQDGLRDYPVKQRDEIAPILQLFGLTLRHLEGKPEYRVQPYAKIVPIDEQKRRDFIMWASEKHQVYSLGRFATWRPGLLLDDVVNDIRVIQRIASTNAYDHKKG